MNFTEYQKTVKGSLFIYVKVGATLTLCPVFQQKNKKPDGVALKQRCPGFY
jgi:hypothetical protein